MLRKELSHRKLSCNKGRKILTVEPRFLVSDRRAEGGKFEEDFQTANRATQYPGTTVNQKRNRNESNRI